MKDDMKKHGFFVMFQKCECLSKHDKEELEFLINQNIEIIKEKMSSYPKESLGHWNASHNWQYYRDTLGRIEKIRTCTDRELMQETIEKMEKIAKEIPDTPKYGDFKKTCLGKLLHPLLDQEETRKHFKFANEVCNEEWSKRKNK